MTHGGVESQKGNFFRHYWSKKGISLLFSERGSVKHACFRPPHLGFGWHGSSDIDNAPISLLHAIKNYGITGSLLVSKWFAFGIFACHMCLPI